MYRASDHRAQSEWLDEIERAGEELGYDREARTRAGDLFLSNVPEERRSKRATVAAALYVAGMLTDQQRPQREVAEAADVSRLTVQQRWKDLVEDAGLEAPTW